MREAWFNVSMNRHPITSQFFKYITAYDQKVQLEFNPLVSRDNQHVLICNMNPALGNGTGLRSLRHFRTSSNIQKKIQNRSKSLLVAKQGCLHCRCWLRMPAGPFPKWTPSLFKHNEGRLVQCVQEQASNHITRIEWNLINYQQNSSNQCVP